MVHLTVIVLCYRITCLRFCKKDFVIKKSVICARPCIYPKAMVFWSVNEHLSPQIKQEESDLSLKFWSSIKLIPQAFPSLSVF